MAIEVDIRKKTGDFSLDVSFHAGEEIFALLGASGCGKSMTLKCIAGVETPDAGRIVLNGRVLFDSEQRINVAPQKRKVGYMFQDYALFPNMTVEKNIMAGMGKHPSRQVVSEYLERFQLTGLEDRLPRQLSGGQKQRVALARMMAAEPEILLLDEPLSALDTFLRWRMEEELMEILRGAGKTTLYVTHSRDEVYHLCDTVCVLERGQMETVQEKKEFFANPRTVAAARISGCRNISAAERISAHELYASDWDIRFELEGEVREDLAYVGIRAHYVEVLPRRRAGADAPKTDSLAEPDPALQVQEANTATLAVDRLLEQQFESELILKCGAGGGSQMRLLMDKEKAARLAKEEQLTIRIPEHALLLLRA